ncbi:uncharacterized protein Dwil_GK21434 [Drosophila willistoni]|nr:uncharacterized protein Dwil_GK21434 [Drosophila willistoni]
MFKSHLPVFYLCVCLVILTAFGRRNRPRDEDPLLVCPQTVGCIKGTYMDGYQTQTFHAFMGIPYAKPPLGPLRFKSPQKKPKWNDIYDATNLKAVCIKKLVIPAPVIQGEEDCLYLNVYRPSLYSPDLLPVMVYIHGGGFFSGSYSPLTSGAQYFMDSESVILVTVSYRLGPLGFLSTGDDHMLGNFGLKDQNLALKWVRENIFDFGGDSQMVTLFGHGFGGIASHLHLLSPMSRGLVHRVISMSGTANAPHAMNKNPLAQARRTAELCGIPNAYTISTAELTEALRNVDAETLVNTEDGVKFWYGDPFSAYRPVVELKRTDAFLTDDPEVIMKECHYPKIPWLLGTVPNEGASPIKMVKLPFEIDGTDAKADCIQKNHLLPNPVIEGQEDCLYLNVYRPVVSPREISVMVYIHGGGFFSGSAGPAMTGPEYFMDTETVILVTMSYRLGALGFLSTGDINMPGNYGLKDQELALKWVRDNIAYFDGDRNRVTLFGHGAGAVATHLHLLNPYSKHLFHSVITMSGTANVPFGITKNPSAQARQTAELCGIPHAESISLAELTEALREIDVITLINASDGLKEWDVYPLINYRPVVEPPGILESISITDRGFKHPLYQTIKKYATSKNAERIRQYVYSFKYKGPKSYASLYNQANVTGKYGVVHSDDLLYLFRSPILFPDFDKQSDDAKVIKSFVNLFVNFAKFGHPVDVPKTEVCSLQVLNSRPIGICDYIEFVNSNSDPDGFRVQKNSEYPTEKIKSWQVILEEAP